MRYVSTLRSVILLGSHLDDYTYIRSTIMENNEEEFKEYLTDILVSAIEDKRCRNTGTYCYRIDSDLRMEKSLSKAPISELVDFWWNNLQPSSEELEIMLNIEKKYKTRIKATEIVRKFCAIKLSGHYDHSNHSCQAIVLNCGHNICRSHYDSIDKSCFICAKDKKEKEEQKAKELHFNIPVTWTGKNCEICSVHNVCSQCGIRHGYCVDKSDCKEHIERFSNRMCQPCSTEHTRINNKWMFD
jgi:hypothetical protein